MTVTEQVVFQIGDRVELIEDHGAHRKGERGIVVAVERGDEPVLLTVRMGRTQQDMGVFASRLRRAPSLWDALLEKVEELASTEPGKRFYRSAGFFGTDARSAMVHMKMQRDDGTIGVYVITVYDRPREGLIYDVSKSHSNNEWYWDEQLGHRDNAVVVNGVHYRIGRGGGGGHAGRKFVIKFNDGRVVTTNDLWYQGPIPPVYRDRMPDNAVFVEGV